jgi:hypothetical protein
MAGCAEAVLSQLFSRKLLENMPISQQPIRL